MGMPKIQSLEPLYRRDPFVTVYSNDPAINREKSDIDAFKRTRDLNHLEFHAGEEPTKYFLRMLPPKQFGAFNDVQLKPTLTLMVFFQICVCKIENLIKPDGSRVAQWEPTEILNANLPDLKTISDSDLDTLFDDYGAILEIGDVAIARHFLHKRRSPDYLAPRL